VITYPNAKLNLGLNVVAKRPDGFHEIETVFLPIPLCDILEIIPSVSGMATITTSGLPIPGPPDHNICLKAIKLFRSSNPTLHSSLFTLHLHKQIPSGSGLGGGSSDGAFTLKMLNALYGTGLSEEQLAQLASQLGSDCAFFIGNRPAFATGKGEKLEEISLSLKGYFLALVIPPVHVGTAEAYSMITPKMPSRSVKEIVGLPLPEWKNMLRNDFEEPVMAKHPEIKEVKEKLYERGAVYASMSGSGSSVYGLFKDPPKIAGHFPENYFTRTAQL
jgi:4-diphosphocytidyl-2-C-methyl-D-erythritol kinase